MKAVRIHENRGPANPELLVFEDAPDPQAATGDVIVRVHAASFVPDELDWPGTWTDRAGRDRTPSIPAHEVAGVVTEVGYGTTGVRHHRRRRARPIGRDRQAGRRAGLDQCAAPVTPRGGRAVFFIVEPDRSVLVKLAQLTSQGYLRPHVDAVHPLAETRAAFPPNGGACRARWSSTSCPRGCRPRRITRTESLPAPR